MGVAYQEPKSLNYFQDFLKLSYDNTTEAEIVQKQIKVVDQIIQRAKSLKHILQYPYAFGFPMLFSIAENDNEMFSNQETIKLKSDVQNIYGPKKTQVVDQIIQEAEIVQKQYPEYIEIRTGEKFDDVDSDETLLEPKSILQKEDF